MRHDIRLGNLPNLFVFRDGTPVVTLDDWMRRREEFHVADPLTGR